MGKKIGRSLVARRCGRKERRWDVTSMEEVLLQEDGEKVPSWECFNFEKCFYVV